MSQHNREIGKIGEDLAVQYLFSQGYEIVDRNFRTEHGELDLVAKDCGQFVFVEVKTRTSQRFGYGEYAVNKKKLKAMIFAAETYLAEQQAAADNWRLDVIVIECSSPNAVPDVRHFINVGLEVGDE
ncbi:MAG: YraN family protein [Chloroflexi bacterium]|nr:YraN family protein [Chloroflexota bacterium]